jgi:hypothetical protein
MEWGWLGSALWALLVFGGIGVAVLSLRRQNALRRNQRSDVSGQLGLAESASQRSSVSAFQEWSWRRRLILPLAVIALAGVAMHGLVDFPLQIVSIQLYVATYLGLCWGAARWSAQRVNS